MKSIRTRLTVGYAVVVALVLFLVSLFGCRLVFDVLAHPFVEALTLGSAAARAVISDNPSVRNEALEALILASVRDPRLIAFPLDRHPPPGAQNTRSVGPLKRAVGPPPQRGPAGFDTRFLVNSLLGLYSYDVAARGAHVVIAPDFRQLKPALRSCFALLTVAVAFSVLLSWLIATRLANEAVRPIIAVTNELRRFAAGDFAVRTVSNRSSAELGDLIAAYNGATAQVAAAMNERSGIEQRLRRFLADAGHELRTPLTIIRGYLEILDKGGSDDPALRALAYETLAGESRRMGRLVERLLALARLERPETSERVHVGVEDVVREAVSSVTTARGGDVVVECRTGDRVQVDPAELHEAVANVVDNAVKYGAGRRVIVRLTSEDGHAVVRVENSGSGVPDAERAHVFERFFRGESAQSIEGSGLGLAIAQRAIQRCGGTIRLENGEPAATVFTLSLPAAPAVEPAIAPLRL